MRGKRIAVWIGVLSTLAVLGCAGSVFLLVRYLETDLPAEQPGTTKQLTLTQVESQARLNLPTGAHVRYGEMYIDGDWAVAAQVEFDRAALPKFLADNGLPAPVDGLRPVPALGPVVAAPPTRPADDPSATPSATPAAPPPAAPATPQPAAPDPAAQPPVPFGPLVRDAPDWHPERAWAVSGIGRHVKGGVARWIMFDLDSESTVVIYIYAAPDVPQASLTTAASSSPS